MAGDDKYEIPESGAVFTFGRSRFAENISSHFFIKNDPVIEISCGDEHTALVCKSGRVFLFGHNDYGQLGFGHTKTVNKPSCLKYLKPFHSTHIACGKGHTIVSTACGRLFAFGCNSDGQLGTGDLNDRKLPQMITTGLSDTESIVALSAGCHHSAFLTDKGKLYLWGNNTDGQCGIEDNIITNLLTPQEVQFDNPINSVSCGYYHTAFTSLGNVFTFGEEDSGKLGRPRNSHSNIPEKVNIQENCVSVKCGGSHTMVLTSNGEVYAFGSNFSGQLGIGNNEPECPVPMRVDLPSVNDKWVYVSCGESHSALLTENGCLYTCGDARYGKLCNEDDSTNRNIPVLTDVFNNFFCTSVSCGGCHTMVLARSRTLNNITEVKAEMTEILNKKEKENIQPESSRENNEENNKESIQVNEEEHTRESSQENNEENTTKENNIANNKENNDGSSPSPDINLNNKEANTFVEDIYSEISEITTDRSDPVLSNSPNTEIIHSREPNGSNDISEVVEPENSFKKLAKIFKKKKVVGPIILSNKSDDPGSKHLQTEDNTNAGNQRKSRACSIL